MPLYVLWVPFCQHIQQSGANKEIRVRQLGSLSHGYHVTGRKRFRLS